MEHSKCKNTYEKYVNT